MSIKPGDWVTVKPEHDIPPMLRNNEPTRGRVHEVWDDGTVEVWVPIGGADVDEHSQSVPYPPEALALEGTEKP
jgi:hypothetical protein